VRRDVELPDLAGGRLAHLALACRELRIVPAAAPPPPALASLHVLLEARSGRARRPSAARAASAVGGRSGLNPAVPPTRDFGAPRSELRAAQSRRAAATATAPAGSARRNWSAPRRRRRGRARCARRRARGPRALTPPAWRGRPRRRQPRRGWRRPARRSAACTPATRTSAACWPSGSAGGRTRWTCARAGRRSCASWRPSTTAVRGRAAALPHPKPMCWTCTRTGRRSCASWRLFEQPWAPGAGGCLRAAVPDA